MHTPANWQCIICQHIWNCTADNIFYRGGNCPKCNASDGGGRLLNNEIIDERFNSFEENFSKSARNFADWIYKTLQKDYEWNQSNECVDENILANEYTFTNTGKRFG